MKSICATIVLLINLGLVGYSQTHLDTNDEDSSGTYATIESESGLYLDPEVLKLPPTDPVRISYVNEQRKRIRNRTLLDLALNYSPTSFISGWYLDPFKPKKEPYIIHADASPQFAIGGEWIKFPVLITPRFKVRILGEDSAIGDVSLPVRTPSFMPGGTIFGTAQKKITSKTKKVYFGSLSVFHHSNGQDGAEFLSPGVFNTYNGNFSNNYVEPAVWARTRLGGNPVENSKFKTKDSRYTDVFIRLGYEINFATAIRLKSTYGSGHMNLNVGWIVVKHYRDILRGTNYRFNEPYFKERYRVLFTASLVTGQRDFGLNKFEKRVNIEGSYHLVIRESPNTAFMAAAGYYGSDPYNIYYADSYFYARIGISAGLFVSPKRQNISQQMQPL